MAQTIANKPANRSRYIQFISGIQGIAAGANATINMGMGRRYHRLKFQCQGVIAYTSTGTRTTDALRSASKLATGLTVSYTLSGSIPNAITIVVGGTGWAVNDTFVITNDATGFGGVGTVTAVSSGVVTAATFSAAGPLDATKFFSSVRLVVNGTTVRDVSPDTLLRLSVARGNLPAYGELPIDFTEPSRNFLQNNDVTAWDMVGQNTFEILLGISSSVLSPNLSGSQEFDYLRNGFSDSKGNFVAINNQIKYREQSFNVGSGTTDINALSYVGAIQRLWLLGSSPNNIYRLEVYQDGEKRLEATQEQLIEMYQSYGYELGRANFWNLNQNGVQSLLSYADAVPLNYFDAAFIPDVDGRLSDALLVSSELIVRVFSNVSQTVKVVMETAPGGYL